jgi:hypothetical protein
MTPLQAARAHCANYQIEDGSCLGMAFKDDLSMYRFRSGPCVFKQALCTATACPYFEEVVLPQAPASTAEEYRKSLPAGMVTSVRPQHAATRLCLDCRKREVGPRPKYCDVCGGIRKRASTSRTMRAKRSLDVRKLADLPLQAEALT